MSGALTAEEVIHRLAKGGLQFRFGLPFITDQ